LNFPEKNHYKREIINPDHREMHIQELKYVTYLKMYNREERKYNTNGYFNNNMLHVCCTLI